MAMKHGICTINNKYKVPFDILSEYLSNPLTGQWALALTMREVPSKEKSEIQQDIKKSGLMDLLRKEFAISVIRCVDENFVEILNTCDYTELDNILYDYDRSSKSWTIRIVFMTKLI